MELAAEQRRHARLDIALAVSYAVQTSEGNASEMAESMASDISAGGIRLMTTAPVANGARLDLEISLPEERAEPIRAQCEVVWQRRLTAYSFETGAVIKQIDEEDKKRFMLFVFDQMTRVLGITNPTLN